jgi:hypothetical protein
MNAIEKLKSLLEYELDDDILDLFNEIENEITALREALKAADDLIDKAYPYIDFGKSENEELYSDYITAKNKAGV